jgi:hypothetical protein
VLGCRAREKKIHFGNKKAIAVKGEQHRLCDYITNIIIPYGLLMT